MVLLDLFLGYSNGVKMERSSVSWCDDRFRISKRSLSGQAKCGFAFLKMRTPLKRSLFQIDNKNTEDTSLRALGAGTTQQRKAHSPIEEPWRSSTSQSYGVRHKTESSAKI